MQKSSIRYGGGFFDVRSIFLKLSGFLQRKKVSILNSDPKLCAAILASSDEKGAFIEELIATPAWSPIISTESVNGELWEVLAKNVKYVMHEINWRENTQPIAKKYAQELANQIKKNPKEIIDSKKISIVTLRILFELVFDKFLSEEDETLFYQASLEWRKEIALKSPADKAIKIKFLDRLAELVNQSRFAPLLKGTSQDREMWLSTFAQPFVISPQINVSDIMVAVFHFLRKDLNLFQTAHQWAVQGDRAHLGGVILESIRLKHPFPILEREVGAGKKLLGVALKKTTQFFILLDQFQQDQTFKPERWLDKQNPYFAIPFGVGPRMCSGKPIAMDLMIELLTALLLEVPLDSVQPQVGHLYSGRDNDRSTGLKENFYQLKVILKALGISFLLGRKKSPIQLSCPFKKYSKIK